MVDMSVCDIERYTSAFKIGRSQTVFISAVKEHNHDTVANY